MGKVGILYDNISGNTGDIAIGVSLKQIFSLLGIECDELIPGRFNPREYDTIVIGGGDLLRPRWNFFYNKFRVRGNHILNATGIVGNPPDLGYLDEYQYVTVRSNADRNKLKYLHHEIEMVPCTTMLLEDIQTFKWPLRHPSLGIHMFPQLSKREEKQFIEWANSLPFFIYFLPITHYNKDIEYMKKLSGKIKNSELLPILKPLEIFTIIGKFDYFISCSLHGAIFAYTHNVPFILFNVVEKMQYFMEDRELEPYLVNNFPELRDTFGGLQQSPPDYTETLRKDRGILKRHVNRLEEILH